MRKIAALFSLLSNFSLFAMFDATPRLCEKTEFKVNEPFFVRSQVSKPYPAPDNFQWKDEDDWKLVSWPSDAIELIHNYATAPDGAGCHLMQGWTLKARKSGKFDLIFQRYDEQIVVPVSVSKKIHKPEWITAKDSGFGFKRIDLQWGNENFLLKKGDLACIDVPALGLPYDDPEDPWKLSSNKKLEIIQEYKDPYPTSVYQFWKIKFNTSGEYTLTFKTASRELVIQIHVHD